MSCRHGVLQAYNLETQSNPEDTSLGAARIQPFPRLKQRGNGPGISERSSTIDIRHVLNHFEHDDFGRLFATLALYRASCPDEVPSQAAPDNP